MGAFGAGALTFAAVGVSVATAVALGAPSGAGLVVAAIDTALIITAVADPFEYFNAADVWTQISALANQEANDLKLAFNEFKSYWEGEGANSLEEYWANRMAPLLDQVKPTAEGFAAAMRGMGTAQAALIGGLIFSTATLCTALAAGAAAMATVVGAPAGAGIQWAAVGAWVAFVAAGVTALVTYLTQLAGQAGQLTSSVASLSALFYEDSAAREGSKLTVPGAALPELNEAMESYKRSKVD